MRNFVILLFLLNTTTVFAQKNGQLRIDSLLKALTHTPDNEGKLMIYIDLMKTYNDFNQDEALKFEKPALALAEKMTSPLWVADIKNAVGRIYWRKGLFEEAFTYHTSAKEIFENANNDDKTTLTIRYIGQVYADGGNYPKALKEFYITLARYKKLGDRNGMAHAYDLLAWVYNRQGNYVEAARAGFAMLELFEAIGDKEHVAMASSEVADYYIHLGSYHEALKYFKRSAEVFNAIGDRINLGYSHNLMGKAYSLLGNYTQSLAHQTLAFSIGREVNDINIMGVAQEGMGNVYKLRLNYPLALTHYLAAVELFKKMSNKIDLARVYCTVGGCYRTIKQYTMARKYYNEAFAITRVLDSKTLQAEYYHEVALLDSATGNWRDAYVNHRNYTRNRDSIFNQDNIKKMVQLQLQHDFDRKEATTKAEQEEKDLRQQQQVLFISIIAILILFLAFGLYRSQQREAKINAILKQKSESLEEENREKTSILNIVSHDLKAPFNKIKGLTNLMQMTEALTATDKQEYITHIQRAIDQGNYLIHSLLEAHMVHNNLDNPILESIALVKFVNDFQVATHSELLKKQQTLETHVQVADMHIQTDQHILTRILDNLVSNASKFSDCGKVIQLHVSSDVQYVKFRVRDQGPGISDDDQKKMFKKFQRLTAQPTAGEGSTGLGLSITKALIEKLNGSVSVISTVGKGTEIVVILPRLS